MWQKVKSAQVSPQKHHCGERKCKTCSVYYLVDGQSNHICFITKIKNLPEQGVEIEEKEDAEEEDVYDEDVEASNANEFNEEDKQMAKKNVIYYFDTEAENEGEHHCNCLCVKGQDGEEQTFYSPSALCDVTAWMLQKEQATFIAHNFGGYDSYFILNGLVDESICPKIIPRGGKILSLSISGKKLNFGIVICLCHWL